MTIRIVAALAAASALLGTAVRADTLSEDNVESRLVLAFRADAAALQKRLPPELEVSAIPAGPSKDANLVFVFYERELQQDADGKAAASPSRFAVVVAAVTSRATGKPGFAVLRGFDSSPARIPGFYKASVLGDVEHAAEETRASSALWRAPST